MEPNKFDNHIKNVLEQRSIKPSENAWSKLESKLDKAEKKKKAPWFFISGIAATLIGVLIMVNISKTSTNENTLVEIEIPIKTETNITTNNNASEIIEVRTNDIVNVDDASNNTVTKTKKSLNTNKNNNDRFYASSNSVKNKRTSSQNKNDTQVTESTLVAVNVSNELFEKEVVESSESDDLLNNALLSVKTIETETIDAESLLYDVEVEVEQSFRTRMFAKIKENVTTLSTVIADRNK